MKKLFPVFLLLLLLAGCGKTQSPIVEEQTREPASVEEPTVPTQEPQLPEDVPQDIPEQVEETVPAAKTAAFLWNDTAVARDGTVVLQTQGQTLSFLLDEITRKPRYILAQDPEHTTFDLYTLEGTFLQELDSASFSLAGTLAWTGYYGNQTLLTFPDGEILADGLRTVVPVGDQLALIPAYQRSAISLWDPQTGTETSRLEAGFQLADATFPWSGSGYLPVTSPSGDGINLIDSSGSPLLGSFSYDILDICFGYAIVQPEQSSTRCQVVDLSTQQELPQTVFDVTQSFLPLPDSAVVCERDRQWALVDWQGNRLLDETFIDRPILCSDGTTVSYLVGQVLRGTQFIPVIVTPDGTVLGELPADPLEIGPVSSGYLLYTTTGSGSLQTAYLRDLETGTDTLLAQGSRIVLGISQTAGDGSSTQMLQIETSGGHMFCLTVDGAVQLFLNDGTPGRLDLGEAVYLGSDVFSTPDGLRCLDGSWLYQP